MTPRWFVVSVLLLGAFLVGLIGWNMRAGLVDSVALRYLPLETNDIQRYVRGETQKLSALEQLGANRVPEIASLTSSSPFAPSRQRFERYRTPEAVAPEPNPPRLLGVMSKDGILQALIQEEGQAPRSILVGESVAFGKLTKVTDQEIVFSTESGLKIIQIYQ